MTIEEAKKELIKEIERLNQMIIDYKIIGQEELSIVSDMRNRIKTYELSIEALEKQSPKNPYLSGDGYWNGQLVYDIWDCPNCGKSYEVDCDNYDYCPECGQKIDWSEVEEC